VKRFVVIFLVLFVLTGCDSLVNTPDNETESTVSPWDLPVDDARFSGWYALEHQCGITTLRFEGNRRVHMRYFRYKSASFWYDDRYFTINGTTLTLDCGTSQKSGVYIEEFAQFKDCPFEFLKDDTVLRIESPAGSGDYWNFVKRMAGTW